MDTTLMNENEYMDTRVNDQINWYERKSGWNKTWFTRMKMAETFMALLIPFLTGYIASDGRTLPLKITIGILGVAVAALTNLITLHKFQENWIQYRTISESLKYEKYLYVTKAGPYKAPDTFPMFVERIEGYISKENAQWAAYIISKDDKKKEE